MYRSLFYDSVGSRIIGAGCDAQCIDTFDLNLNRLTTLSFSGLCPHGVTVYNTKIYATFWTNGNLVEITNNVVTNTFTTVCSNRVAGIIFKTKTFQ
jgi:hypothetical protein